MRPKTGINSIKGVVQPMNARQQMAAVDRNSKPAAIGKLFQSKLTTGPCGRRSGP